MNIKQFEYKPLAHYSYAVVSNGKMAVIDPKRNPEQYYAFAKANNAKITAVIETHPHADFVSSHLEIYKQTGATIYNSEKLGADYPHQFFDEGDSIQLGKVTLKATNTPGHSPDSITVVATEENETALFTGDTLFIGDVGRPDLREKAGNMKAKREELAEMMYETITNKFKDLPDDAIVYPAHGAGSLCGKNLSEANSSTLGNERMGNWAFKKGHLKGSINIQAVSENAKFETWLGSIVKPEDTFTLVIDDKKNKEALLHRVAKIGYEKLLDKVITLSDENLVKTETLDLSDFKKNPDNYTIVDIRNTSEVEEGKLFDSAISHPLNELRETASEIPTDKPIVVHCAGGYRSAAGSSILQKKMKGVTVYDLSENINDFKQ